MKSNQTLYLDEGAFVYGYVVGKGIENVRIAGEESCVVRRKLIAMRGVRN